MRGNNDMMDMLSLLCDKVDNMLASKNKPNVVDTKKEIVFSYFDKDKVTALDAQEFHYYSSTLIELDFAQHRRERIRHTVPHPPEPRQGQPCVHAAQVHLSRPLASTSTRTRSPHSTLKSSITTARL